MNAKRNLIAHYAKGGSDKVYMSCVRCEQRGAEKAWVVIGKWGKRGGTLSSQIKRTTTTETEALLEQAKLFREKLAKGYEDIDSAAYDGPVSRGDRDVARCLEDENGPVAAPAKANVAPKEQKPKEPESAPGPAEDMAAVCVSTAGLEDRFDEGIEYVFEEHADKTMIWVYDKMGDKREYFKDRFRLVKAS